MSSQLALAALNQAISQIGQEENPRGSNWGHPIQDYLARVDTFFEAAWCMAFMYWCFDEAANSIGTINPLVKTPGVLHAYNSALSHHVDEPQIGDIFIIDFNNGTGHTGIVERVHNDHVHTIEGNTNDTGSREGYEVLRKIRKKNKIKGYLRY